MSDISFKKFSLFIDGPETSDEQITEIFGLFKNNDKLEKLKKERERLKAKRAGVTGDKEDALDIALKNLAAGKKPGVILDKDLQGALGSDDRKFLAKDDAWRDKEADRIRKKLGIKEGAEHFKVTEPGWYVVDHKDRAIKGPMSESAAEQHAKKVNDAVKDKKENDKCCVDVSYFTDYQIRRMNEAVKAAKPFKATEPGYYVVDHMDKPIQGPMQEGAAYDRADKLNADHKSDFGVGDVSAYDVLYFDEDDIKSMKK